MGRKVSSLGTLLGLLALALGGCGKGLKLPPMAKVDGKVTYNGKPLTGGTISFFPLDDKSGHPAIGEIDSNGSFELTTFNTGDGAVLGQHKAVVSVKPEVSADTPPDRIPSQLPEDLKKAQGNTPPIPAKYSDPEKTPLRYTVRAEGNHFDVELKD